MIGQRDEVGPRLRRRIRRPGFQRIGLQRRSLLHRSVDLVGPDVDHPGNLEPARRVHHHVGAEAVGVDEVVRAGDGAVDVALGCEVDHGVVAGHGLLERARVADVALDEAVAGIVVDVAQRRQVAGIRECVVDGDLVVGVGQDPADVVGADEPRPAGDELPHAISVSFGGQPVRSAAWGRRSAGRSDRRGLSWSRADSTGSDTPQSAPTSGSSHATPSSSAGL